MRAFLSYCWAFVWFLLPISASAQLPLLQLTAQTDDVVICGVWPALVLPSVQEIEPDQAWQLPLPAVDPTCRWVQAAAGKTVLVRGRLQSKEGDSTWVVHAPITRLDSVQIWYRTPGEAWKTEQAGDLVPLSKWPFAGQFPAFVLHTHGIPVEVMLAIRNNGSLSVPLVLRTDRHYREIRLRQANLTGLIIGLGIMVCVVCFLSAVVLTRRASWVLFLLSLVVWVQIIANNGYMAIWFTPDWPELNDAARGLSACLVSGCLVWTVGEITRLDTNSRRPSATLMWVLASIVYVVLVQWVWPAHWRAAFVSVWAVLSLVVSLALAMRAMLLDMGRQPYLLAGLGVMALAVSFGFVRFDLVFGLELRVSAISIAMLLAVMLMRHHIYLRERFGRDILRRGHSSAVLRDPLTGLLSLRGIELSIDRMKLIQNSGRVRGALLMVVLPQLEEQEAIHGYIQTERALQQVASALQASFGYNWQLARVSKSRFVGARAAVQAKDDLAARGTAFLAHLGRINELPHPVKDLDLRLVIGPWSAHGLSFVDCLRELELHTRLIADGKRMVVLRTQTTNASI